MVDLQKLPLFPLHTVLFPGMVLPLHIFEYRYRRMVYHCVTENEPFGVVLIREGSDVGGQATFHEIGTTAQITRVDPLTDGRMNIATVGYQRFKIHDIQHDEPYLVGLVETFPLEDTSAVSVQEEMTRLHPLLRQYLGMLAKIESVKLNLDEQLPDEPEMMAYLIAMMMQVPLEEKQKLLMISTLPELLRRERKILKQEIEILRIMVEDRPAWVDLRLPFSPN